MLVLAEKNFFVVEDFDGGSTRKAVAILRAASFEFVGMGGEFFLRLPPRRFL